MRFISKKEVKALISLSFTQIARLEDLGKFPKRFHLGERRNSRVAWLEAEVLDWMKAKIAERKTTQTTP